MDLRNINKQRNEGNIVLINFTIRILHQTPLRREAVTAGKILTANPEESKRLERRSVLVFQISSHHIAVCLTARPQPLPRRVLHRVRSSAPAFNLQYLLLSLRSSSSFLHLLLLLPVISFFQSRVL